jgi:hypothetical protein
MRAHRYKNQSTTKNLEAILSLLRSPLSERLVLYATPFVQVGDMCNSEGGADNLPWLAARADVLIPAIGVEHVVFDGSFLTCECRPRYLEIRTLLDACEKSGKTDWSAAPAPFTSRLNPQAAAHTLLATGPTTRLTADTRAGFFAMLSRLPEAQFASEGALV